MTKFLFVGGSQRSGTTLLQSMLCLDPQSTPKLAEASYLRSLMQAYQQAMQDFDHDTASYFDRSRDFQVFHAGIIYSFLQRSLARFPTANTLVLKEPHLTPLFPQLAELVAEARFVLIMRDPRDIIASMIDVGKRMKSAGQPHFFQQRDIAQLSGVVKSFYAPTINHQDPGFTSRYLVIRYEDLIQHNEDIRLRLAAFTGLALDFDSTQVATSAPKTSSNQPRYAPWYTANSGKQISDSSIGRHRQVLTAEEIEQIEQHCSDVMQLFKYA